MPESKGRNKARIHPAAHGAEEARRRTRAGSCRVMLGLMVVGLLVGRHLLHLRVAQSPIPALGRWNLGVGFGLMLSGFLMTTRWR